MAKKPKTPMAGVQPPVSSRDVLQRLNYLYQVDTFLSTTCSLESKKGKERETEQLDTDLRPESSVDVQPASKLVPSRKPSKLKKTGRAPLPLLQRLMTRTMRDVAKKGTVRMDPSLKRTFCKSCNSLLLPGITCSIRNKPSGPHSHLILSTCYTCGAKRKLPSPPTPPSSSSTRKAITRKEGRKEIKDRRRARKEVFFEKKDAGHQSWRGGTLVVKERDYGDTESRDEVMDRGEKASGEEKVAKTN